MLSEREGLDARRWADLMSRLSLANNLDTFERLQAASLRNAGTITRRSTSSSVS